MVEYSSDPFYDKIAHRYHWLLSSWDGVMEREMDSLVPVLNDHNVKSVLDCACGTGLQVIGLSKAGFDVLGSDLNYKMLEVARRNAKEAGFDLPLVQSDFRYLRNHVATTYDAVICMGNSIPHLMNDVDIAQALISIGDCMKENGLAIIEFRNYDKLLSTKTRFLPMRIHEKKDDFIISILYVLDYIDNIIRFNVVYLTEDTRTGETIMEVQSVDYNPIGMNNFCRLLKETGFKTVDVTEMGPNLRFTALKSTQSLL